MAGCKRAARHEAPPHDAAVARAQWRQTFNVDSYLLVVCNVPPYDVCVMGAADEDSPVAGPCQRGDGATVVSVRQAVKKEQWWRTCVACRSCRRHGSSCPTTPRCRRRSQLCVGVEPLCGAWCVPAQMVPRLLRATHVVAPSSRYSSMTSGKVTVSNGSAVCVSAVLVRQCHGVPCKTLFIVMRCTCCCTQSCNRIDVDLCTC